ncbi:MAG: DUF916 domain-containing protein [Halanaerobiales bacterium]|nr:DUF916 domain-containing protein [Halanaerobiales bacterium]
MMRYCTKIKLSFLFLTFWILICSNLVNASTYIEPSRFILHLEPGAKMSDSIKVTNMSNNEIEVRAVLYDWKLDEKDELVTYSSNTRQDTLYGLIKFNPRQFKLAPGETQIVRFTVKAPQEGFDIERKGIVFFEQESVVEQDGVGVNVLSQIGTTIYTMPSAAKSSFCLAKAEVYIPEEGISLGVLLIGNEGNVHVRYHVKYKISNEDGKILDEGTVAEKVILPEDRRLVTFPITPNLPIGRYNLLLEIAFDGTNKKLVHTVPFDVKGQE